LAISLKGNVCQAPALLAILPGSLIAFIAALTEGQIPA